MGDGVPVYCGNRQAHEDQTERAVRAGLELIGAVSEMKPNVPLQTCVGIATGTVVVGDLIGSGEAQERGIVGETPNLAARLQGIAEPVRAWAALRASSAEGRFEALHASEMTALLGREEELELLLRRWAKAKTGGQLVLLPARPVEAQHRLTAVRVEPDWP